MSFQSNNGRCTVATYEAIDETTISVNNSEISTGRFGQTKRSELIGRGEQTYPDSQPNGLKVTFSFSNKIIDFFANLAFSFTKKPNYYVYETDYESYALGELLTASKY